MADRPSPRGGESYVTGRRYSFRKRLPAATFGHPKRPALDDEDYRNVPSTSGCSTVTAAAGSRKRKAVQTDSDSDDSEDERQRKVQAQRVIDQKAAEIRGYREYELVYHGRQIVILYEDFTWKDEDMLQQLVTLLSHKFNICVKQEWDETVTHLIVKTSGNNMYQNRSIMYMYALLSHCFIINTKWIQKCLNTGYLVPENNFTVKDRNGETTAVNSWLSGHGVVASPMEWTENCILFFYDIDLSDETYTNLISWTLMAGFVIAEKMSDLLNDKLRFRFIIASGLSMNQPTPSEATLKDWLYKYRAASLNVSWLMDCLYSYKFVIISQRYQVLELDEEVVDEHLDIMSCNFEF